MKNIPVKLVHKKASMKKPAIIDNEDFTKISKWKWHYKNNGYLMSSSTPQILMHRLVMEAKKGQIIDHINGDKFDNRKTNLRFVTNQQNGMNRGVQKNNKLGIKGVSFDGKKFRARLQIKHKNVILGRFKTKEEASSVYQNAVKEFLSSLG